MREIKFRAWYKVEKKMFYPNSRTLTYFSSRLAAILMGYKEYLEDTELMQNTGLKDKNGNEIYEGDILMVLGWLNVVKWSYKHAGFIEETKDGFPSSIPIPEDKLDIEVIGNIYKNPELLE